MIIVTGGAGFIGSNIVQALNKIGRRDILLVDNLENGRKFTNLVDLDIADYRDKEDFLLEVMSGEAPEEEIDVVFHLGACSATTEWNGKYMMDNNYQYSKELLHYCLEYRVPLIYASSAATYGGRSDHFIESREYERPLNVYGYSKLLFDEYVRNILPEASSPVVGLRYFNVYGPREDNKGDMASVAWHLNAQIQRGENPQLFVGSDTFKRDFIYVDDVVNVNLWCWQNNVSGIFNCGSGRAESFQAVAQAVLDYHQQGSINYIPFPDHLRGRYQCFTQADLTRLRAAGYQAPFATVADGVRQYMAWLNRHA